MKHYKMNEKHLFRRNEQGGMNYINRYISCFKICVPHLGQCIVRIEVFILIGFISCKLWIT